MSDVQDKILGSWMGLAIGEAMGAAVRGMKPATIVQCFKTMNGYKDVRPFIGKGVKQYRMKGLYGAQTQTALAACDVLLSHKQINPDAFLTSLFELKQTGPELYCGVFRHPEACLLKALESLAGGSNPYKVNALSATATFLTLSVPIALYHRGRTKLIVQNVLKAGQTLHCHILELFGMAMMARLIEKFLQIPSKLSVEPDPEMISTVLLEAVQWIQEAEDELGQTLCLSNGEESDMIPKTLSKTLRWVEEHNANGMELDGLLAGICEKASEQLGCTISHAAQGTVLVILPTAVLMALWGSDFAPALNKVLHLGGEGDKLGAITGALAGALYGFKRIPEDWRKHLVNSKEIKFRGEALINKKTSAKLKNLFEMETGLTYKEAEERKRFLSCESKKKSKRMAKPAQLIQAISEPIPEREDRKGRRKYEREKSRKKRDRREKPDS